MTDINEETPDEALETASDETRAWDVENPDITAEEYLVGCLEQRWVGDEESQTSASGLLLAQVFMAAGMGLEEALDAVEKKMDGGVSVSLTEEGLSFTFGDAEADGE